MCNAQSAHKSGRRVANFNSIHLQSPFDELNSVCPEVALDLGDKATAIDYAKANDDVLCHDKQTSSILLLRYKVARALWVMPLIS